MIENLLSVGHQVLVLFILISIGFIFGKAKILRDQSVKDFTELVLYIVTPCVIVKSFLECEFNSELVDGLFITAAAAIFVHLLNIAIAHLTIHDKDDKRERVLRFASVFSNCGFMSIPLQEAILGANGVFYGAVFLAVFNVFVWSYGVVYMSGEFKALSPKKLLINPGIIGVVLGIIVFFFNIRLPDVIEMPIKYMAGLNTPVPMVIIGFYLANTKFAGTFKDYKRYWAMAIRLVISPLLLLLVMYVLGMRGEVMVSCTISACAPVAAITTMFSVKYDRDSQLSVGLVSVSTILSIITMPLVVALSQYLA